MLCFLLERLSIWLIFNFLVRFISLVIYLLKIYFEMCWDWRVGVDLRKYVV